MKAGYKETPVGVIPEDWQVMLVNDYAYILDNKRVPLSSEVRSGMKGGYPYCGANGVVDYIDQYVFEGLHVLIAEDGGNFHEYQNRPISYLMDGRFWVNNHAHVLRAKNGEHRFLHYSLVHKDITKHIIGSTRTKLNKSILEGIPLAIPTHLEQSKIASILSTVDDKIDSINQRIEETRKLKQGLMQQLLTRGIGHTRFKDSPLGEIPESWEVVKQGTVAKFINGRAYKLSEWEESGTPVIRLQNLTGRGKDFYYSTLSLPEKQYCKFGDLLYMWSASFGAYIWKGNRAIFHYHIWKIDCVKNRIIKMFLYYLLTDITIRMKDQSHGSTMIHITKEGMEKFLIQLPPITEQNKITDILINIDDKLKLLKDKKMGYEQLKKGLMQQLLTGKLRVTA